jgi:hypothetical protein
MGARIAVALGLFLAVLPLPSAADISGDARRLLAHRVRATGVDPKNVTISGIVAVRDQALLSWDSGKQHGVMGLVISGDRWWDALDKIDFSTGDPCWVTTIAYPLTAHDMITSPVDTASLQRDGLSAALAAAALQHNQDVRKADGFVKQRTVRGLARPLCEDDLYYVKPDVQIHTRGATVRPSRVETSGYDITLSYARNDAPADAMFSRIYARPPTAAEFAPNHAPAPGWGGPDAVCFFDIELHASKPVTFQAGTTMDIWFPFVLDDQLRYNLSFFSDEKPSAMIFGTIFDNTLHFVLPAFTIAPDKPMAAEIDGDPK